MHKENESISIREKLLVNYSQAINQSITYSDLDFPKSFTSPTVRNDYTAEHDMSPVT